MRATTATMRPFVSPIQNIIPAMIAFWRGKRKCKEGEVRRELARSKTQGGWRERDKRSEREFFRETPIWTLRPPFRREGTK
jgi:hypothetical protein